MRLPGGLPDASKNVGRTWPDFLSDHLPAGLALAVVMALVVALLIGVVLTTIAYRRAIKDRRSFTGLYGLFALGAPPAVAVFSPAVLVGGASARGEVTASKSDALVAARGAMAIVRAAAEIAAAKDMDAMLEREGYLLTALFMSSKHHDGGARRASILWSANKDGDEVMSVRACFPDALFQKPYASFSKRAFDTHGIGLCWAAVHECQGGHAVDSIKRSVFHAADVSREPSFVAVPGHRGFQSILIAPVVVPSRDAPRSPLVLGAVCLDAERTAHYDDSDQHLIATAALALSVAWQARYMEASLRQATLLRQGGGT